MLVSLRDISIYLVYFSIFTSSFDIFLVVNLGFNFRISQLVLLLCFAILAILVVEKRKIKLFHGFGFLFLWSILNLIFVLNSYSYVRAIGYSFWLFYYLIMILFFVFLFDEKPKFLNLIRVYIYSFLFIAAFGLFQFISPFIGLQTGLITQWWIDGILPRINGFSYEPSYYATYLLIGFIFTGYLIRNNIYLWNDERIRYIHFMILLSMVLSSSRMGIAMIVLWYSIPFLNIIKKVIINALRFKDLSQIISYLLLGGIGMILVLTYLDLSKLSFLLQGIGLGGSSTHSTMGRLNTALDTFRVFLQNPIFGVSLGGVAASLAHMRGFISISFDVLKMNEGMVTFIEVLAASGILGFIPFLFFLKSIVVDPFKKAQKLINFDGQIIRGLVYALIFELLILQLNQNILRPYLWIHIAILLTAFNLFNTPNRIRLHAIEQ